MFLLLSILYAFTHAYVVVFFLVKTRWVSGWMCLFFLFIFILINPVKMGFLENFDQGSGIEDWGLRIKKLKKSQIKKYSFAKQPYFHQGIYYKCLFKGERIKILMGLSSRSLMVTVHMFNTSEKIERLWIFFGTDMHFLKAPN